MKITKLLIHRPFMYFWGKYVNDFNIKVHCAKCLIGHYSNFIKKETDLFEFELNEFPFKYFYICGVSKPYRWHENFHLALKESKGKNLYVKENGIEAWIEDAERIEIQKLDYPEEYSSQKPFHTCRNWQFGYQMFALNNQGFFSTR
jgi:hypothetical protein